MYSAKWSDKVEEDMLFAVLASNPTPTSWSNVVATMAQHGLSFSVCIALTLITFCIIMQLLLSSRGP